MKPNLLGKSVRFLDAFGDSIHDKRRYGETDTHSRKLGEQVAKEPFGVDGESDRGKRNRDDDRDAGKQLLGSEIDLHVCARP